MQNAKMQHVPASHRDSGGGFSLAFSPVEPPKKPIARGGGGTRIEMSLHAKPRELVYLKYLLTIDNVGREGGRKGDQMA
jgi:hypothetical protein